MASGAVERRTSRLGLAEIRFNFPNWGDEANKNLRIIDALLGTLSGNLSGPWINEQTYAVGARVIDTDTGTVYTNQVPHISSAVITFAQERVAHPSYWLAAGSLPNFRGTWTTNTQYYAGDFLSDGYRYAVVNGTYVSGASYNADVLAGNIRTLVDLSTAVSLTGGYKDSAFNFSEAAKTARNEAVSARDTTLGYRDTASSAASTASTARTAAETARDISVSAKDTSVAAKDAAIAARDSTISGLVSKLSISQSRRRVATYDFASSPASGVSFFFDPTDIFFWITYKGIRATTDSGISLRFAVGSGDPLETANYVNQYMFTNSGSPAPQGGYLASTSGIQVGDVSAASASASGIISGYLGEASNVASIDYQFKGPLSGAEYMFVGAGYLNSGGRKGKVGFSIPSGTFDRGRLIIEATNA